MRVSPVAVGLLLVGDRVCRAVRVLDLAQTQGAAPRTVGPATAAVLDSVAAASLDSPPVAVSGDSPLTTAVLPPAVSSAAARGTSTGDAHSAPKPTLWTAAALGAKAGLQSVPDSHKPWKREFIRGIATNALQMLAMSAVQKGVEVLTTGQWDAHIAVSPSNDPRIVRAPGVDLDFGTEGRDVDLALRWPLLKAEVPEGAIVHDPDVIPKLKGGPLDFINRGIGKAIEADVREATVNLKTPGEPPLWKGYVRLPFGKSHPIGPRKAPPFPARPWHFARAFVDLVRPR